MGFNLNKARAEKEELLKSFTPLDLNEGKVQAIFNWCLATKDTPNADVQLSVLFKKVMGYETPWHFVNPKLSRTKRISCI